MKLRYPVGLAALLGLLVPLIFEVTEYAHPYMAGSWLLWIWPSSMQLMVLENRPPVPVVLTVVGISVGANVLLYAGMAWAIVMANRLIARLFRRDRRPA
jgi:hypothetical protein